MRRVAYGIVVLIFLPISVNMSDRLSLSVLVAVMITTAIREAIRSYSRAATPQRLFRAGAILLTAGMWAT